MAFILQDNTPVVGANAYVSVGVFRTYHSDRGTDSSAYSDAQVEVAIIKATQYLDLRFEYVGQRSLSNQDLEWPRQFAYSDRGDHVTGLPTAVVQATAEYANRALTTNLLADPVSLDGSGRSVKKLEQTVGPITEKFEFELNRGFEMPDYPIADRILISKGLISSGTTGPSRGGIIVGNLARGS